ncbi:MAG: 16S rRNA (cytosine(1402)-N(4))-methyltransferase RsmH [Flavobacteriales bacterium]|nr:16S rRNA (cytosine(1402)-N(4))-methyltransferase RsmH [Flavobacteriales bacterium]
MNEYHVPALLSECLEGLNIQQNGTYVDVTFGGGGHSRAILKKLNEGRLIAFDQDSSSITNKIVDTRFELVHQNFKYLNSFLKLMGAPKVDGILADLGVSFHQFDTADRGFSIRNSGPLDMRMNQNNPTTAAKIINEYEEEALKHIFRLYGELKEAGRLARKIIAARSEKPFKTTQDLVDVADTMAPHTKKNQFLSKVFQAVRIEVNQELETLQSLLEQAVDALHPGGRLVVISYHSLEDKLVKNYMKTGNFEGKINQDLYGNIIRPLTPINRKVLMPSDEEIKLNPRSRSAKLRIAERT